MPHNNFETLQEIHLKSDDSCNIDMCFLRLSYHIKGKSFNGTLTHMILLASGPI